MRNCQEYCREDCISSVLKKIMMILRKKINDIDKRFDNYRNSVSINFINFSNIDGSIKDQ